MKTLIKQERLSSTIGAHVRINLAALPTAALMASRGFVPVTWPCRATENWMVLNVLLDLQADCINGQLCQETDREGNLGVTVCRPYDVTQFEARGRQAEGWQVEKTTSGEV